MNVRPQKGNQYQRLVIDDGKSSADGYWKRWPRELERIAAFFRVKENPDMPDDTNKTYYAARARGERALASASKHPNVARIHAELAAEYERRADAPKEGTLSLFTKKYEGLDQSHAPAAGTNARLSLSEPLADFDDIIEGNVGLMRRREASVNDVTIAKTERRFRWDSRGLSLRGHVGRLLS